MSSVSEKLLEDEITDYLVSHAGYLVCKNGVEEQWQSDFDAKIV